MKGVNSFPPKGTIQMPYGVHIKVWKMIQIAFNKTADLTAVLRVKTDNRA